MTIRMAEQRDVPQLEGLLYQVHAVHARGRPDLFKPGREKKYTAGELAAILDDPALPVFVCEEGDALLGHCFCALRPIGDGEKRTLYIDDLCVDEKARGKGVGRRLYEHALSFARGAGCYDVTLNVWACNPGAMAFYEKMGLSVLKTGMEQIL